jgi:hypothetical protein
VRGNGKPAILTTGLNPVPSRKLDFGEAIQLALFHGSALDFVFELHSGYTACTQFRTTNRKSLD